MADSGGTVQVDGLGSETTHLAPLSDISQPKQEEAAPEDTKQEEAETEVLLQGDRKRPKIYHKEQQGPEQSVHENNATTFQSPVAPIAISDSAAAAAAAAHPPLPSVGTVESDLIADSDTVNDSAYEDSVFSDTTSLRSSIFQTLEEHGHGYHRDGRAILPIDETEQDRLDLQHHIYTLILDGELMVTKLPDRPQTIIDVGTGTGIWAIETGDKHPLYQITGIDQSPIQPNWIPPNVSFEIDDINKEWLTGSNTVDFIHVRSMAGSIRGDPEWRFFLAEAFRMLKPGGRIEVADFTTRFQCDDGTFTNDSSSKLWEVTLHDIASSMGIELESTDKMHGWLQEAGFGDIGVIAHKVPVGPWPRDKRLKDIGRYHQAHMLEAGFENYSIFLFTQGGWSIDSTHILLAKLKSEIRNPKIHTYAKAVFFTAVKPGRHDDSDEVL